MSSYKAETQGRYAHTFKDTQGPGDGRPTANQVVKDEGYEGKLGDKVMVITGCSSGIGIDTAKAMALTGARLFLGVRNVAKGEEALKDILKPGHVELLTMDLNSLDSVRAAAEEVKSKTRTLNILINNAGIMALPTNKKTANGFEAQFGTNHLAHFLFFQLLKPLLLASSTLGFSSRVIALSSSGHRAGPVQFDDYGLEKPDAYKPWAAYGQSKTANIYMANEIDRRYGAKGLHAWSVMPGGIMTGLQEHVDPAMKESWSKPEVVKIMKDAEQGAATSVYAALHKDFEGKGGKYLEDCDISGPVAESGTMMGNGYAPWAYDEQGEKKLWTDSCKMVGVSDQD